MDDYLSQFHILQDLETRHDELLQRLDELDRQIERVLGDWTTRQPAVPATQSQ